MSIPVFDHNLIKIVIVQTLARQLITAIWLFLTFLLFMTVIFAVILHDENNTENEYIFKIDNDSNT